MAARLVEIRSEVLAFNTDEGRQLLTAVAGRELPDDQTESLVARTDGWAAGLQLAAISLQTISDPAAFVEAFAGTDRLVVEYLTEEVLDSQDEDPRRFLLSTSVLPWLTADLCDAVTGDDSGHEHRWLWRQAVRCSWSPSTATVTGIATTLSLPICFATSSRWSDRRMKVACGDLPQAGSGRTGIRQRRSSSSWLPINPHWPSMWSPKWDSGSSSGASPRRWCVGSP